MRAFDFPQPAPSTSADELRLEVREFLATERANDGYRPMADGWCAGIDPEFSRKLGARGYIGVSWPVEYGGRELSMLHRHAITEELLVAGAPVHAHWIADRQSGPLILDYGTEAMKRDILPRIARGECFFAIGLSEPNAGSDLAAVATRATRVADGWRIDGTKLWSSGAHSCQYMILLARTRDVVDNRRHEGLSQFLVDLRTPGVRISGIRDMSGQKHFNETHFKGVVVPEDALLGDEGDGWRQVTGELALERSGPERFLSTFVVLEAALAEIGTEISSDQALVIGRLLARVRALRAMSLGIAERLRRGESPETEAALVKDIGTRFEGTLVEALREIWPVGRGGGPTLRRLLADALVRMPSYTIRGGTNEVLKGIVTRGMGLR